MSKDSGSKPSIQQIFDSMEYGPVSEGKSLAEAWLLDNVENFGPFINGKMKSSPQSEKTTLVSTGVNFSVCFMLDKDEDYSASVSASSNAFSKWAELDGHERASIIYSIARQLQKHISLLCEVEALSRGVQVGNVRELDVPAAIRTFYYYAGWAQLIKTELKEWKPHGPVAAYTSGSAPLSSLAMIIAPALAAGNTITLLPHVSNCLSALLLAHICTASGVPPGVINVVPQDHSDEMLCPVVHDNQVRKVAVVGSPCLGRSIFSNTLDLQQNHVMLLNGCVPMIVLDSADLDAVVDCVIDAAWINQGQDPWALRLLIVQESVYSALKSKLTARIKSLKTGSTFEKMADVSHSVADSSISKKLKEMLTIDPSSEVVKPSASNSDDWAPTVIFSSAPPSVPVLRAIDVCPAVHVVAARSAKEAVGIANHCGGGMAASIWTESSAFAWESALQMQTSTVWINSHGLLDASIPISGRNFTGSGSFLGKEGLLEFLKPSSDSTAYLLQSYPSASTSLLPLVPSATEISAVDQTYKLFYGGGHKRPNSNTYRTVLGANGESIAVVPEANRKDVRNAVEAAVKVRQGWWKRGSHNRAQIIYNLAEKLKARESHFARCLQTLYQNLDLKKCEQEVNECVNLLFHFAAICDKAIQSTSQVANGGLPVVVMREPLGVIGVVCTATACSALADLITLIGAAIAYGNVCVVVTDLERSTPALELAQLLEVAEIPGGVINILSGGAISLLPTLGGHMDIDAVWCTGHLHKLSAILKEEISKSNLKQNWVMERVLSPLKHRHVFEMKASQSKAIWLSGLASFGS
ncbi:aldehyde dehydrogenase family 16 member A1-like [Thrips palmi]|uniref:Aldehyde dehydrogenase family 16 member A1-like n=1 Tax=Thrips palmi TaxID=161013 RepID=A0A6P8YE30_THRPL|nr:aldehyde dehydrogenase family 16 member A1-like [Thrips palmi]